MHTAAKRGAAHPLLLTTAPTLLTESSPAPLPSRGPSPGAPSRTLCPGHTQDITSHPD